MDRKHRVAILTPVFNEEDSLPQYVSTVTEQLLSRSDFDFHVTFIDDGSEDKSWKNISDICASNRAFSAIRLSRNFGSHIALSAGFQQVDADVYVTLASDLQDPPEIILAFLDKWSKGARIVWGKRESRKDQSWRVWASNLFFHFLKKYAFPNTSKFTTGSFLLADRIAVNAFREFSEHNRITFALFAWTGFDQEVVSYHRQQRQAGQSGWNFSRMMKTMYDAFLGFSQVPIKLISLLGWTIFLISILVGIYVLINWAAGGFQSGSGWTSLMLTICSLFGLQFLLIGFMGEYLSRIYTETTRRPLYFISERIDKTGEV